MTKEFYRILEISENATQEEIKKAYRKLALKWHPDKQGGNEDKFKEIVEAYEVLSNPTEKQNYENAKNRLEKLLKSKSFLGYIKSKIL